MTGKAQLLDFDRFRWLSFDCYGTLVDWETGISTSVADALRAHDRQLSRGEILALFSSVEPEIQQGGEYLEYREVLRRVMAAIGTKLEITLSQAEESCLVDTIGTWPIFPDTVTSLRLMKGRYKLAIISNVDDDLFAPSARALGVEMDAVITAQQCRSYKPNHGNFRVAQERMGVGKEGWLHIAESLHHDIGPANQLGIRSVWVNRGHGHPGGATRQSDAKPDLEVHSLAELTGVMGLGQA
jgi:2-haloacid dehalogenase